jgi:hypothetical protein
MASTIQLKTGTGSAVPSSLTQGEVAINIDNGLFYFGSGSSEAVKILESFTHITASGNISASGNIFGNGIHASGDSSADGFYIDSGGAKPTLWINPSINTINVGGAHPSYTAAGVNIYTTGSDSSKGLFLDGLGNITASGNISSSGNLYGTHIYTNGVELGDAYVRKNGTGNEGNILFTNITASGNISASGYLVAQNITASNISASGYIYGRQFEQLDSVADTIVINTSYVYLPLGGQSQLEQALTTNKNVQKLAIAPGKLRKVIIRVTSGATGLGTTGFTCSYHSAIPGTGTVNVVGEKYANSLGTSHEVVTFDFTTGVDGGTSWDDVTPGSRVYLSLKADTSLGSISHLGVASLWEWDYNA